MNTSYVYSYIADDIAMSNHVNEKSLLALSCWKRAKIARNDPLFKIELANHVAKNKIQATTK